MADWQAHNAPAGDLTLSQHATVAPHLLAIGQPHLHAALQAVDTNAVAAQGNPYAFANLAFVQVSPMGDASGAGPY